MNDITYGALKRIIEEVKEYRKLPTNTIGGNDIQLVEEWMRNNAPVKPSQWVKDTIELSRRIGSNGLTDSENLRK